MYDVEYDYNWKIIIRVKFNRFAVNKFCLLPYSGLLCGIIKLKTGNRKRI